MLARVATLPIVLTLIAVGPGAAQETLPNAAGQPNAPASQENSIAYFLGISVGQSMAAQGFQPGDFDLQVFVSGMSDALADKAPAMSDEQLQQTSQAIQTLLARRQKEAITGWMAENAKQEGFVVMDNGIQYKVLKEGSGKSPGPNDTVKVHYTGTLTNGNVFDSSVERGQPAEFQVGRVIKGWQLALQKMKVGSKWTVVIPPELGYGERGAPPAIGPNEILVFEVELLDIL